MSDEWRIFDLQDVLSALRDGTHGSFKRASDGVRFLSARNIGLGQIEFHEDDDYISARDYKAIHSTFSLAPNDVLLTIVGTLGRRAVYRGERVTFQRSVAYLRAGQEIDSNYLYHLTGESGFQLELQRRSNATAQAGVYLGELAKIRIKLPPLREQRRIAEMLDTLDDQIRATEQVIAKLNLAKQGLISDLLTKGVSSHGQQHELPEDSEHAADRPIEIPHNWVLTTIKEAFSIKSGITLGPHRIARKNSPGYLRVANVQRSSIRLNNIARLHASKRERVEYELKEGDLLIVEGHADVNQIGRCALVGSETAGLLYQNHLFRLRSSSIDPSYAETWLNSDYAKQYWRATCSTSSGLNTINSRQLGRMLFALPPKHEQSLISEVVKGYNDRIRTQSQELDKLRSLKQGLMSDLLTGRVRVPAEAAP